MLPVYKVNNLQSDNLIKDIYVFTGLSKEETNDLTNNFRQTKKYDLFERYFTDLEIDYIEDNDVNVEFIPMQIYDDDNIDTLKRKIILATDAFSHTNQCIYFQS